VKLLFFLSLQNHYSGFLYIFGEDLLLIFGASENTIGYAIDYMNIYVIGTIFVQMALGMNMFITCQGFTKISMLSVVIGAVLNIILDPILIFNLN
jgi:Na+-driven multidrug efflux pump